MCQTWLADQLTRNRLPIQSNPLFLGEKNKMLPAFDDHSREVEDTSQNRQEKVFQAPKNYLNSSKVIVYVIRK